jgi:hypothetical protein
MESSNLVVVKEEVAEEEDKDITGYPVLSISCDKIDPLAR